MVKRLFVDRIVFSVPGIALSGFLTDPDPLEAEVKRAMIGRARFVVLVAQAQKFNERGLNVVVPARQVDTAYLTHPRPPVRGRSNLGASTPSRSERRVEPRRQPAGGGRGPRFSRR